MRAHRGLTLLELLVVLGMIVLLVAILLPALSTARQWARQTTCLSNLNQLHAAYLIYVADNNGMCYPCDADAPTGAPNTDEEASSIRALAAYTHDTRVFHCPCDERMQQSGTPRSYSINEYLGGTYQYVDLTPKYPTPKHAAFLKNVTDAARTFMWIEETPDVGKQGLTGGFVVMQYPLQVWADYPAILHRGGTCIGFVDGHCEYWQWDDPRTVALGLPPKKKPYFPTPNNPDLLKLQGISGNGGVPRP